MLGGVDTGEGAVYFLAVLFCQIVYSHEVTEIIVGFIRLHDGISCNTDSDSCRKSSFVKSVCTRRI